MRPHFVSPVVEIPEPVVRALEAPGSGAIEGPAGAPASAPATLSGSVPPVTRIQGGPAAGFPNAADYYPAGAIRAREQGVASVQVCVDPHGRLTSPPTLDGSSGSERLDTAALRLAASASGHYRPTSENAQPVSACFPLRIRFQLRE
jgi:TonB family protein